MSIEIPLISFPSAMFSELLLSKCRTRGTYRIPRIQEEQSASPPVMILKISLMTIAMKFFITNPEWRMLQNISINAGTISANISFFSFYWNQCRNLWWLEKILSYLFVFRSGRLSFQKSHFYFQLCNNQPNSQDCLFFITLTWTSTVKK